MEQNFGLQISVAWRLIGGMFGAAIAKRISVVNGKLATETLVSCAAFL